MSGVEYVKWDSDDRVSKEWYAVLSAARRDGVAFTVTDGHRTMAEQRARYAVYQRYGHPLAARPSPTAPHIAAGHPAHAIDVNALDGGVGRLLAWLRRHGVDATRPVVGEAWHVQASDAQLVRLARRLSDPLAGCTPKERRWIRAYDALLKQQGRGRETAAAADARERLLRLMTARRKAIWHVAQETGWDRLHRRARYEALKSRTR
jgi:hypothetical protein